MIGVIFKTLFAGAVITFAAWLSGKRPGLAGFIIALPMMSMLSILFSYIQYRDMEKINQFATSIIVSVPLSLTFFIPFILNKWLKWGFAPIYLLALACLFVAYFIQSLIFKS